MKKKLSLLLALAMAMSLTACGGDKGSAESNKPTESAPAVSTPASGDKVVRIGVFEPSTGDSGPGGKQEMLGKIGRASCRERVSWFV